MVSKVFMDRRLREDGTEQGSANVFLCGLPPFKYPPNKQGQEPEIPSIDFPGLNTTLLYVAPPGKIEEVSSPLGNNNLVNLFFFQAKNIMKRMTDFITPLCQKSKIMIRPQIYEDIVGQIFKNNIPIGEYKTS